MKAHTKTNKKIDKECEILRTWIEVDTKAAASNFRALRKLIPKRAKLLGVVKSNAYGHGLAEWSTLSEKIGIDWLGVDSLVEGLALRKAGVKIPILVLGHTLPALLPRAQKEGIAVTLSSLSEFTYFDALPRSKNPLRVHLKVDTGMHRQGFQLADLPQLVSLFTANTPKGGFVVEGLYTHFAKAKNPREKDSVYRQLREFSVWSEALAEAGLHPLVHTSATSGLMLFPQEHVDIVRSGIGLYGLWPSKDVERHLSSKVKLHPALAWRAMVSEVKTVNAGERVGYDLTELLLRETVIAIIPIGYWHGFPRALSGAGRVLIHGKSARVLGRVSMNMITVDVTDIGNVHSGDIATLIGKDGKEEIPAGELATLSGTTHYEILARLNPLMKKFYQ